MKRFLAWILPCLLAATAHAGSSRFDRANERFAAGEFAQAADLYQDVISAEGPSAAALFNLGNCEQRLGRFGPAILAYERARLLTPRDPDLIANLAQARKSAAVFEEAGRYPRLDQLLASLDFPVGRHLAALFGEPGHYPRMGAFFGYLSLNQWSWLVAGCSLFLGALAVVRGCVRLRRRGLVVSTRAAAGLAAVFILIGSVALWLRGDEWDRGVVLSENAAVRLSPFGNAESVGSASPGRIVRLLGADGGFRYIEVPGTGLRGWMSGKDVGSIQETPEQGNRDVSKK